MSEFFNNIDLIPGRLVYILLAFFLTFIVIGIEIFRKKISVLMFLKKNIGSKFNELNFDELAEKNNSDELKEIASSFSAISGFICLNVMKVERDSILFKYEEGKELIKKIIPIHFLLTRIKQNVKDIDVFGFKNYMIVVKRLNNDLSMVVLFKKIDYTAIFK